ncbi:hypothetical protein PHMEG_00010397 [Phytophthora megakarya]|uniref:Uncharacterized protein n=1 Tax=Phytophthora megakarya TaxID=4795 RepID=A0A225WDU2_9STRA|nr:hypothetical protein PHMEG_00010397 [Phytophthora megakarya]
MAGATTFRPPEAELRVHQVAQVRPRSEGKFSTSALSSYWRMSLLDRVSPIQTQETLRNSYQVTKVTAKMLFSVNFGSRPLDHFLLPEHHGSGRSVGHDPAGCPVVSIITISDLRSALRILKALLSSGTLVFRAVFSNSTSSMLDNAPHDRLEVTRNLYTQVFISIFHVIRDGQPASRLVDPSNL